LEEILYKTLFQITWILIGCATPLFAFSDLPGPVTGKPLILAHRIKMESEVLKETRHFDIVLPEAFHEQTEAHTYPVLLLLEGAFLQPISGAVRHWSGVERMPETIIVSIPTHTDNFYAPSLYLNDSDFWPKMWEQMPVDGSPELFRKFLEEELFPYLEKHFRANSYRMVMGTSATSIYVFHAFAREPGLFRGHIAIAAGDILGMGYQKGETLVQEIKKSVQKQPDLKRSLYVASTSADAEKVPAVGQNIRDLVKLVTPILPKAMTFQAEVVPDPGHYDIVIHSFLRAMELQFPGEKWHRKHRELEELPGPALANVDAHYKKLSQEVGFTVLPRAHRWNSANCLRVGVRRLQGQGRIEDARAYAARWMIYRPRSPHPHMALAKLEQKLGNTAKALEHQSLALSMAISRNDEHLIYYQAYFDELQALSKPGAVSGKTDKGRITK
jgi:predicted alpha/beta superfamily hydrolase